MHTKTVNMYNSEFASLAKAAGISADSLYDAAEKLVEYDSYIDKEMINEGNKVATFLASSEIASTSEYGDQIV
jgi:hypothetical protein